MHREKYQNPFDPWNDACLVRYVDTGYLLNPYKAYSQIGYVFTIEHTTISWRSTKHTIVVTSSNHAEILDIHEEVHECIWLRAVTKHVRSSNGLNSSINELTIIYKDNTACI